MVFSKNLLVLLVFFSFFSLSLTGCVAVFDEKTVNLVLDTSSDNTVLPSDTLVSPAPGIHRFTSGSVVELVAEESGLHEFVGWTIVSFDGALIDQESSKEISVMIDRDLQIIAEYKCRYSGACLEGFTCVNGACIKESEESTHEGAKGEESTHEGAEGEESSIETGDSEALLSVLARENGRDLTCRMRTTLFPVSFDTPYLRVSKDTGIRGRTFIAPLSCEGLIFSHWEGCDDIEGRRENRCVLETQPIGVDKTLTARYEEEGETWCSFDWGILLEGTNQDVCWHKNVHLERLNWYAADDYCKNLNTAGRTWSLPTKEEWRDVLDNFCSDLPCAFELKNYGFNNFIDLGFWTQTSCGDNCYMYAYTASGIIPSRGSADGLLNAWVCVTRN